MGAKHKEQLSDCYHFINSILNMEYDKIYKGKSKDIKPRIVKAKKKTYSKRIRINVKQISNFETRTKLLSI